MIRPTQAGDHAAVWAILEPVIRAGETYTLPHDMSRQDALAYWLSPDRETWVAEADGQVLGLYALRANRPGGGDHVANASYMTAPAARGRGVARAMAEHSLERARARGFRAIQFNFVVAANAPAVHLWTRLGFETVGRLPGAFRHPTLGDVDALVMFRTL